MSKTDFADSIVEADLRIGHVMDKDPRAGPRSEHAGLLDYRQRCLAGRLCGAGYTPFRGPKGTVEKAATVCPQLHGGPARSGNPKNHDIAGGLDLVATSPPSRA